MSSEKIARRAFGIPIPSKKDKDIDVWKARLQLAKKSLEPLIEDGDKNVDAYEGSAFSKNSDNNAKDVRVNLTYVDLKQSIPQYYSKNPKIFFEPEQPGSEKTAEIFEIIVNQKWDKLKMKSVMRDGIKTAKLYGMCGFKTYFNFQKEFVKDEWADRTQNDEVRTDRIPLKNLLKDPSASSWETSPWIAHKVECLVEDIAEKFDLKVEEITVTRSAEGSSDAKESVKTDFQFGTYYEIEDRKNGTVGVIVEGIDKWAKGPDKKTYDFDSMYDFLSYNDIPDRPNVLSDYTFWRQQAYEVSRFRTMLINHAKKGVAKYKWVGVAPTENQQTQVKSSQDSTIVELSVGQDIVRFDAAQIDPQIFQADAAVRQDIQLISKQAPRQAVGQDKTATEVKAVEAAAQEVTSENLEALEEVMASIAGKWASLMKANYTATRVISLTEMSEAKFRGFKDKMGEIVKGDQDRPFISITNKNLKGEVCAKVKAGSTLPDSDRARMAKLTGFSQFVASIPGLSAGIDMEELLDEAVNVFDVRNDNLLLRKDNPMEESRLLNAGVFISAKLSEDHDKHIQIHEMESNGNQQNIIHLLEHKEFKKQIEENQKAAQASQLKKLQEQPTGQSFVGQQGPLPPIQPGQPQGLPMGPPQTGGLKPPGVLQ